MAIVKIISGGQTGADRGGLEAAIYTGTPHGGYCPKGRKAEDGQIPDRFSMTEMRSADYLARTEANVFESGATLVVTFGRPSGGTLRTIEFCRKHGKPYHCVDLATVTHNRAVADVCAWLSGDPALNEYEDYEAAPPAECVLNVAGNRESKADGIEHATARLVVDVLRKVNPECAGMYPLGLDTRRRAN
jgi:hypothetical protein